MSANGSYPQQHHPHHSHHHMGGHQNHHVMHSTMHHIQHAHVPHQHHHQSASPYASGNMPQAYGGGAPNRSGMMSNQTAGGYGSYPTAQYGYPSYPQQYSMYTPPVHPRRPRPDRFSNQPPSQLVCCYFLQGTCKFKDKCRYSHEDKGQDCLFGTNCRLQHHARASVVAAQGEAKAKNEAQESDEKVSVSEVTKE